MTAKKLRDGFYWLQYKYSEGDLKETEIVQIDGDWFCVIGTDMPYRLSEIEIVKSLRIKKPNWKKPKKRKDNA